MALDTTTNRQSFTAVSNQTKFDFTLPYFETSDIKVLKSTSTTGTYLTYNANPTTSSQFKVEATNSNPADGATITLGGAAQANATYTIIRTVPYTQQYDLQEGATIDPTALNKALDRIVAQNQQQVDTAYSGGQSIEFANGLIAKFGLHTSVGSGPFVITFDNHFPQGLISVQLTPLLNKDDGDITVVAKESSHPLEFINGHHYNETNNSLDGVYWLAIGY